MEKKEKHFIFLKSFDFKSPIIHDINYEVFYRYYHDSDDEAIYNFDFIITDVTRTKINEEKNNKFKAKNSLIFKTAHELKNPLICINELIEQLKEIINENQKEIFSLIKAFSNYLLILIQDLEYFSIQQHLQKPKLIKTITGIDKLL